MSEVFLAFYGVGMLVVTSMFAWIMYQLMRPWKQYSDKTERYDLFETAILSKFAESHDLDLNEEKLKRRYSEKPSKDFRRAVEDKMFEDFIEKKSVDEPSSEKK